MHNQVSLCMIVKNEEENLKRCLESVKDIVDEIILVDTGSKDKTVEIAQGYGTNVYYFEWRSDFSAARNESLKYATKEWILIMDADDEFCSEDIEKFRMLLKSNLDANIVYFFETLNYFGGTIDSSNISVNLNPRLFKNNYGYCYEGKVHNQLVNHTHKFEGTSYPIKMYHYGYLDKNIDSKDKRKRNITLLEEQIKNEPDKKYAYFNLGNEHFALNDKKKALEYYYKSYENFNPHIGYGSTLIARIVISHYILKQYIKAMEFIDKGIEYYPKFTDMYFLKALILRDQNKSTLEIKALEKCIEMGDPPSELKFLYGTGSFRAFYELANVYMKYKDYDSAYNLYVETIRLKPDFLTPLYVAAHILKEEQTSPEDFKKTIESFFTEFPKAYPLLADMSYMEGYYETALDYIAKYEVQKGLSDNLKFLKIKCLIRLAKYRECIRYIDSLPTDSLYYFQYCMHKLICLAITGSYEPARYVIRGLNADNLSAYSKKTYEVYKQFLNLLTDNQTSSLSEDENDKDFTPSIFEICEILLINREFDKLEKALGLFNLISDKTVLLQLGKLYYKHGYTDMAKKELLRSVKIFDVIDIEALDILKDNI